MPTRLILPLEEEMRLFYAALEHTSQDIWEVENFLDEILIYVHNSWMDIEGLDEFLEHTAGVYPWDAHILVPALARLGKTLLRELHICGAYTSDGLLWWRFGGWINHYLPYFVPDFVSK